MSDQRDYVKYVHLMNGDRLIPVGGLDPDELTGIDDEEAPPDAQELTWIGFELTNGDWVHVRREAIAYFAVDLVPER